MTPEELSQYVGLLVEVRLASGESVVGRLDTGVDGFVIVQPSAAANEDPPRLGITDAALVETVRSIPLPPQTLD
jgi:predicted aspartyl protease